MPSKNFGMRLAPHERHQIEKLAEAQGKNMKDAILEAVRQQLSELGEEEPFTPRPGGRLEGLDDLVGCFDSGFGDLSTNKDHMDGYGE